MCSFLPPALDDSLLSQIRLCGPRSKVRSNLAAHESWPGQHQPPPPLGSGCCFYSAIVCEIYFFQNLDLFFPQLSPAISLRSGHHYRLAINGHRPHMLRMVRPDKQNYNNNAPDDNEDNHQSPHLTINPPHDIRRESWGGEICLESWIRYIWL